MIENKYSHEQQREAIRAVKDQYKRGGSVKNLPQWMREAYREYYNKYETNRVREQKSVYRTALPEDHIIDWLAVELVSTGQRVVNLTHAERVLAVAKMLRLGLRPVDMASRLGTHNKSVSRIVFQINHNDAERKILKAIDNQKYEVTAA